MILFRKLRFKNLLSYGNQFTEINLNSNKTTLIIGKNGVGKSTFLDALTYVLYGKPYRKIKKPQLINSTNKRDMVVEVEFVINGNEYFIRRGQRPAIFEVYKNDVLINQDSKILDYQDKLEKNVLKLSYKSFLQIVILGSAAYIPFMELPTWSRREVIEDLLDLQIFSIMNNLLKEKASINKNEIKDTTYKHTLTKEKIEMQTKHNLELDQIRESMKKNTLKKISESKSTIEKYQKKIALYESKKDDSYLTNQKKLDAHLKIISDSKSELRYKIKNAEEAIDFFNEHDNCPTCKQEIEEGFKASEVEVRAAHVAEYKKEIDALNKKEEHYLTFQEKIDKARGIQEKINSEISRFEMIISNAEKAVKEFESELNAEASVPEKVDINSLVEDRKKYGKLLKALSEDRELYKISAILLKDGGIKTRIIKQYIPIMNKMINKYLSLMEFPCQFELNETFNETIRSRYRDEFSYASFSEGEKLRITLAILFTWRTISKMRNSISTNILIFDEIGDSSLDVNGFDEFMKIIDGLTNDSNVFIISHKVDTISDKFENVIEFTKEKGFSKIKDD